MRNSPDVTCNKRALIIHSTMFMHVEVQLKIYKKTINKPAMRSSRPKKMEKLPFSSEHPAITFE